jgi:oligopeptide transport system permease protein
VGRRHHPLTRSSAGVAGMAFLALMLLACMGSLPWTLGRGGDGLPRYNAGTAAAGRLPPFWVAPSEDQARRFNAQVTPQIIEALARTRGLRIDQVLETTSGPVAQELRSHWPRYWLGTDVLGRSLLIRCLAGGGISLGVGLAAAMLSVFIGTLYGTIAGYAGGRLDAVMMRIVDVLYGLPYVLLVVLLAVAGDAVLDEYIGRSRERAQWVERSLQELGAQDGQAAPEARARLAPLAQRVLEGSAQEKDAAEFLAPYTTTHQAVEALGQHAIPARRVGVGQRAVFDLIILLVAIGGVSWLTMARVIRGQVLSLKAQPFIEATRAIGVPLPRVFTRHLLPNLVGSIVVYTTLTVPQAILQESFLSFLGIGVKPPLPSWGTLAADGLEQLNPYQSNWWLLLFPCLLLGLTLLALNFVGEGLREAMDPRRARR